MPFFIMKYVSLICDNCGKCESLNLCYPRDARKKGWSISKDYKKCYCPDCTRKRKLGIKTWVYNVVHHYQKLKFISIENSTWYIRRNVYINKFLRPGKTGKGANYAKNSNN